MRPAVEAYLAWLNEQGCELRDTVVVDMGWPVPTSSAQRWNAIGASIEDPVHRMAFVQMQAQANRDAARLPRMEFDDVEELAQLRKTAAAAHHRESSAQPGWLPPTHQQVRALVCGNCGVAVDISTLGIRDDGYIQAVVFPLQAAWRRNWTLYHDCGHPR